MHKGTIKILREGWGFIALEDNSDIFFHQNDLEGASFQVLTIGDEVEFEEIERGERGAKAKKIKLV